MTLITIKDLAHRLKISLRGAYKLVSDGEIAYYAIGRCKRIAEEDLELYLERQRKEPCLLPVRVRRHF